MPPAAAMPGRMRRGQEDKLPVHQLSLDLQSHQQKENRHQTIVDPMQDAQPGNVDLQDCEIEKSDRRVGCQQGCRRGHHQYDAAGSLAAEELSKR